MQHLIDRIHSREAVIGVVGLGYVGLPVSATLAGAGFRVIGVDIKVDRVAMINAGQNPIEGNEPGLQELLTMFHPMVAGVTIPGMGLFALMLAPYTDRNPSNKPEDRKFAITLFTIFMMFWAVLVLIGSFFRGPGFNFILPWNKGIFFEF